MKAFLKAYLSSNIIISIIVAIVFIILYILIKRLFTRYCRSRKTSGEAATVARVLFSAVRVAVAVFGVLLILEINGVNIGGLMAGLGIASAVVGLALQDYLKDIVMGVHILTDHFYVVGECVEYDGREGVILGVTLKTTKIGDLDDHSIITVCNREITKIRRLADRMDIDIPLSYGEDLKKISQTLTEISSDIQKLDDVKSCEFKGTQAFESSAVIYRLRLYCDAQKRADVRREALSLIQLGLERADIHIPFNQLDVHCDITK